MDPDSVFIVPVPFSVQAARDADWESANGIMSQILAGSPDSRFSAAAFLHLLEKSPQVDQGAMSKQTASGDIAIDGCTESGGLRRLQNILLNTDRGIQLLEIKLSRHL